MQIQLDLNFIKYKYISTYSLLNANTTLTTLIYTIVNCKYNLAYTNL